MRKDTHTSNCAKPQFTSRCEKWVSENFKLNKKLEINTLDPVTYRDF